jgi:hypothetical protein
MKLDTDTDVGKFINEYDENNNTVSGNITHSCYDFVKAENPVLIGISNETVTPTTTDYYVKFAIKNRGNRLFTASGSNKLYHTLYYWKSGENNTQANIFKIGNNTNVLASSPNTTNPYTPETTTYTSGTTTYTIKMSTSSVIQQYNENSTTASGNVIYIGIPVKGINSTHTLTTGDTMRLVLNTGNLTEFYTTESTTNNIIDFVIPSLT